MSNYRTAMQGYTQVHLSIGHYAFGNYFFVFGHGVSCNLRKAESLNQSGPFCFHQISYT